MARITAFSLFLWMLCGGWLTPIARSATTAIATSNLGNPDAGFFTGFVAQDRAVNSFTTGDVPALLSSATLRLGSQSASAQFRAFIYADNLGLPGSTLGEFDNRPSASAVRDVAFFTNMALEANTRYWLGVSTVSGAGRWNQVTGPSTGPWTIGGLTYSADGGATWLRVITSRSNAFSLNVTLLPEPATVRSALIIFFALAIQGGFRTRDGRAA